MKPRNYSEAGVDIGRGDRFAEFIAGLPSAAVSRTIGAFAGGIPLPPGRWRKPVLLGTTDGVGTKLLVAERLGDYSTVGIDLVAMCVNDLAVCGAEPLFFLDYIACGRVDHQLLEQIIAGVVKGCEIAGCTLTGGETAELPDMYSPGSVDLAGFAVGVVEADEQLPQLASMAAGDVILALPSSGIHSNGLSLARKVLPDDDGAWRELLVPTRIYVEELGRIRGSILAAAHVTGGGLAGNLGRVIPPGLEARFAWDWPVPPVFERIQRAGAIATGEMRRVFNMGIGIAMIAHPSFVDAVTAALDEPPLVVGELVQEGASGG